MISMERGERQLSGENRDSALGQISGTLDEIMIEAMPRPLGVTSALEEFGEVDLPL